MTLQLGSRKLYGEADDLSKSGIFVLLKDAVSEGQRVTVVIDAAWRTAPIVANGTVVHTLPGIGVGVRFSGLSVQGEERISALVAELRKSA